MTKLVVSDLDGTLLDDNSHLPQEIHSIINSLLLSGIYFTVASGRQINNLKRLFNNRTDIFYIAQNGSYIEYANNTLYTAFFAKDILTTIIDKAYSLGLFPMLYSNDTVFIRNKESEYRKMLDSYNVDYEEVDEFDLSENIGKISLMSTRDDISKYKREFMSLNGVSTYLSHKHLLDLTISDISKGTALSFIQKLLNINNESTMTFGDSENDISMFKISYYSFAMQNSSEEIKKYAKYVAPSNNDNGVIQVLLKMNQCINK